jgi:hypothetical protein
MQDQPRRCYDELFPDAVQILDLFHLKENIYTFAKHLYGDDPTKYVPANLWFDAESLIARAENSRTDALLGKLLEYKGMKLPPGVVNIYTYVYNNRSKIDYLTYRAHGYYVGSGPSESGNKIVLQKRCKQAGMRWNERCAQHMLTPSARDPPATSDSVCCQQPNLLGKSCCTLRLCDRRVAPRKKRTIDQPMRHVKF